jgi:hypothetical protein
MGDATINQMIKNCRGKQVEATKEDLCKAYETLDGGNDGDGDIALVALGNPHLRYVPIGVQKACCILFILSLTYC